MKKSTSKTPLFDVRLKNVDHDVIVLKGAAESAASTFLSGSILLSVSEPISVRRIGLRLYGTLRLAYGDTNPIKGGPVRPHRFEKKVYEYVWDSNEMAKYMGNMYENAGGTVTPDSRPERPDSRSPGTSASAAMSKATSMKGSTTSLKSLGMAFRSKSLTSLAHHGSLASLALGSSKSSHVLVLGNYEVPFSAILPGNMPESVEGLPGGSVTYKLEATLDRGKFSQLVVAKRHVRVVRTMTTDAVELLETVAVDNTWPHKVEYLLSVPARAIAVGLVVPISLTLLPLLKGLRLGDIRITLVELYLYVGVLPPTHTAERVVAEKVLKSHENNDADNSSSNTNSNEEGSTGRDSFYGGYADRWELTTRVRVPPSLLKCTQDCDILTHVKVRHRLKFTIALVNPDGHTSELRASLPVQLFISPFVGVRADCPPADDEVLDNVVFESDPVDDAPLRSGSQVSFTGLIAPPVYDHHMYDQLWSDVTPVESPVGSGTVTPRSMARPDVLQFSMSLLDLAALSENLRQLSVQRENGRGAVFNLDDDDYFRARPNLPHTASSASAASTLLIPPTPGVMSPPLHLSRAGSASDITAMDKVPSYSEAMRSPVDDTLAPRYMPPQPGSGININEVNKRFEETRAGTLPTPTPPPLAASWSGRSRLFLTRGLSSFNLMTALPRSASNHSLLSKSREVSGSSLTALGEGEGDHSKSRTGARTGSATFSMPS